LRITGGDLKVIKSYWTLQDHEWENDHPKLITNQYYNLTIAIDSKDYKLPHVAPNVSRTLVRVSTNPANDNKSITTIFYNKLAEYIASITSYNLSPSDIMDRYYKFWWLSIKYMAPALILSPTSNILQKFHRNLLPKIKINSNVPLALIPILSHLGGFNLKTLEMEQYIESINIVISCFNSILLTSKLLQ